MAGEIEAYQDSLREIKKHEDDTRCLNPCGHFFTPWTGDGGRSLLAMPQCHQDIILNRSAARFDPKNWPTGQHIGDMLLKWHELNGKHRALWDRIPQERRYGLEAPQQRTT